VAGGGTWWTGATVVALLAAVFTGHSHLVLGWTTAARSTREDHREHADHRWP
jgi:cell division inhibitor SulA